MTALYGQYSSLDFLTTGFLQGRQPQPPTLRTRPSCLWPPETGWPRYKPRHRLPILVAFYDTHELRWDYYYPPVTTWRIITWQKVICFVEDIFILTINYSCSSPSQWPRGLRRTSAAAWLLKWRVRIPLEAWMFVSCVYKLCCPV
jgi:hypothetical protein